MTIELTQSLENINMSSPSRKKLVLTPLLISAVVFGTLSLPLVFFGKKPVTIQLQEEPIFSGQLREIAGPYLGLASLLSLGAGFASFAITGWMNSTRKSSQVEAQLSSLTQNLREKEAQLEALKLSESQLAAAGLSAFLDESVIEAKTPEPQDTPAPEVMSIPEAAPVDIVITQPLVAQPFKQSPPAPRSVQSAAAMFSTTQSAFGYTRPQSKLAAVPGPTVTQLAPLDVSLDVKELHTKLEEIRAQMATLQSAIASSATTGTIETAPPQPEPEDTNSSTRLQVVNWSVNKISS